MHTRTHAHTLAQTDSYTRKTFYREGSRFRFVVQAEGGDHKIGTLIWVRKGGFISGCELCVDSWIYFSYGTPSQPPFRSPAARAAGAAVAGCQWRRVRRRQEARYPDRDL